LMRHDETLREDRDTVGELRACGLREDERAEQRSARLSDRSLPNLQVRHELSAATIENVAGIEGLVEAPMYQLPSENA
jgi:hypothetical protein